MALKIGTRIGPYQITARVGAGGMGEVYRATDTKLKRDVAIKVLPEAAASDRRRVERFKREARILASLNHPHIASIFGLEESGDGPCLVLELVEGRSLAERLSALRVLPVRKALRLALQIASALEAAHERGIVHRDLKPENIQVTSKDRVKVLDFGLAKILEPVMPPEDASHLPTRTEETTRDGAVMGTPPYMSPEQIRGEDLDSRTDIWAFGCVLYEMLVGTRAFPGRAGMEIAGAILERAPDWTTLRERAPGVFRLVQRCLRKDPHRRLQHIGDARAELEDLLEEKGTENRDQSAKEAGADQRRLEGDLKPERPGKEEGPVLLAPGTRWNKAAVWAGAVVAVALTVALVVRLWPPWDKPVPPPGRLVQLTTLPGLETSPTWSPDGGRIAYVSDAAGNLDIYVQQVSGGPAIQLTDSDADDAQPAWSPDGSRIAFVSARARPEKRLSQLIGGGAVMTERFAGRNGDLWVMPALGGSPRMVAQDAYFPAWSPDGRKLAYQALRERRWGLWIQEMKGEKTLRRLDSGELPSADQNSVESPGGPIVTQPAWSADGSYIAFTGIEETPHVYIVPSEGGPVRQLTPPGWLALTPSWSADGAWLYFSSNHGGRMNLWRARFESDRLGPPQQVTNGSGPDIGPRPGPTGKRVAFSTSDSDQGLCEYDLRSGRDRMLTTARENLPSPSPDGRWLTFAAFRVGAFHLWLRDQENGAETQVTSTPSSNIYIFSQWSRDSKSVFFENQGAVRRYEVATGITEKVYEPQDPLPRSAPFCLSADERYLLYGGEIDGEVALYRLELASKNLSVLVAPDRGYPRDPACSPDGEWVAFHQIDAGNLRKIWIVPLKGGEAEQLTFGESEDSHPTWSADGRLIYFVRNHQEIYAVPSIGGEAERVTDFGSSSIKLDYPAATADGKKLLFIRDDKHGDIYILEDVAQ